MKLLEALSKSFELLAEADETSLNQHEFVRIVRLGNPDARQTDVEDIMTNLPWEFVSSVERYISL